MRRFSTLLAAILALMSCSVKEDRMECPCDVTVMSDGLVHKGHRGDVIVSVFLDQLSLRTWNREDVPLESFTGGTYHLSVPKGWFAVSVVGGTISEMSLERDTLLCIPPGCQCDSVCAFSRECYTHVNDDECTVKGPLNKQFCTLTIRVLNDCGESIPCELAIRGEVDGFNLLTLEPHRGEFRHVPREDAYGRFMTRLPRQSDSPLLLDISIGGNLAETLDLDELINLSGYSWGTLSLEDVDVRIEYSPSSFSVTVNDWETEEIYVHDYIDG